MRDQEEERLEHRVGVAAEVEASGEEGEEEELLAGVWRGWR